MKRNILSVVVGTALFLLNASAFAQPLNCYYASSSEWGSGWCDLQPPGTFVSGTCLRLKIGGTASRVLIRFLPAGAISDDPVGIMGGIQNVPESREMIVSLGRDLGTIKQISIHGNPRAWQFDLGADNGPATLQSVEEIPCEN